LAIGAEIRTFAAGAEEYGTLVRVTGPLAGLIAVLRYAEALAITAGRPHALPACDGGVLADALAATATRAEPFRALAASGRLAGPLVLLASGMYAGLVGHLQSKLLEGLLVPLPPVYDLLEVGHGPFQQAFPTATTFLALTRPDAPGEDDLLER